ncbi:Rrf2 family transcriptional regulator [Siccirubricoccus deserti]|uniref:Rrf2 family transcriptional regulator n=1 Tax=Siccirubricoccus deserti TaxID=2013562 RepID=A0A9X0UBZ8_9PROT|nr:Rrf2 family transcriptional regulator [Siccirubricoccus deserti]MBC4014604.1 Rrf2 family transcriptional regulator [Siccirubricoccus deserti]GGC31544.1 Rrf2 family transcriptional regulator [Siccirubricoccus deserti]
MLLRRERAMTAVAIMLDVAFHAGRTEAVSAADIAERLGQARRGIEPVLQALSRAGLLDSIRGPKGGYRLGHPARDLRLAEIVSTALDDDAAGGEAPAGRLQAAVVHPLWSEMEALCRDHLARLTIADLIKRAAAAGVKRPTVEPLNFVI